jgi:hypothetical protein
MAAHLRRPAAGEAVTFEPLDIALVKDSGLGTRLALASDLRRQQEDQPPRLDGHVPSHQPGCFPKGRSGLALPALRRQGTPEQSSKTS